ncbi:hypothetical protein RDWZM_005625 [Blomia tropicalis]|uniref:Uncharacterized protein n=1 Tax=Blomia tropicalis TaxID=40697 RepID=A0A9Q0M4C0_BLOTA|nr:Transmembrane protein 11, mitochondrial [Blomia tropicalis]KAJ6219813.1 hypothetical protein RDWZM_005625 [Blomia tropicalis]
MVDEIPFPEYGSELVIIREIFDGAHELFENELEHALDINCETIVIEPCRLGEETARWIFVGDCLSRTSIITGLGSIMSAYLLPDRPMAQFSLLATSLLTNSIHTLSWQSDTCSAYRVERSPDAWSKLMGNTKQYSDNVSLVTSTDFPQTQGGNGSSIDNNGNGKKMMPVILCRRSNSQIRRSNLLKAAVSLIAFAFSVFRLFKTTLNSSDSIKFTLF